MDFGNMNIWCWLIPLLCTLLGAIFGYFLGRAKGSSGDLSASLKRLQDENDRLKADLAACNKKLSTKVEVPLAAAMAPVTIPFDAGAARAVFGKAIRQDDLKVVEGIGPKIESMFKAAGIGTWQTLSETTVAKCREILDSGGEEKFRIHDPASWPMQAKMAYEGKWKELKSWQDDHDHGKL